MKNSRSKSLNALAGRVDDLETGELVRSPASPEWPDVVFIRVPFAVWRDETLKKKTESEYRREHQLPLNVDVMAAPIYGEYLAAKGAKYRDRQLQRIQPERRREVWAEMGNDASALERLEANWIAEGLLKPDGSPLDHVGIGRTNLSRP